jgi:hypothetical protein
MPSGIKNTQMPSRSQHAAISSTRNRKLKRVGFLPVTGFPDAAAIPERICQNMVIFPCFGNHLNFLILMDKSSGIRARYTLGSPGNDSFFMYCINLAAADPAAQETSGNLHVS